MAKCKSLLAFILLTISTNTFAQKESLDIVMVNRIKNEGLNNSKVMDIAFQLTDVNGPRLTNSPGYQRAASYAKNMLTQWGLVNASLVPFGEFGKGWELEYFYMAMKEPYYKPLIALPRAWTEGTNGLKSAEVFLIEARDISELAKYRGKLSGKILIVNNSYVFQHGFEADSKRFSNQELVRMAEAKPAAKDSNQIKNNIRQFNRSPTVPAQKVVTFNSALREMAMKEEAIAIMNFTPRAKEGTIIVGGLTGYKSGDTEQMPDIMLTMEDYMTTLRLVKAKVPVKIDLELKTKFSSQDLQGYNVIAEIPGTDTVLKDEVVMIGGHLDSWHGSTGATDNAAGVAILMEAVRILKVLNISPRRTIRIALWGGEEQGLLGSKGYAKSTFYNPDTGSLLPTYDKFSVYYNLDNGGGRIRGVYLEGNEGARPIFTKWFEPFVGMGAETISANSTGGTDHSTFVRIGLPGFQFIQDPLDYHTRTHHTNMDSYDHLIEGDLKSSAIIMASILYHSAMREGKFPRQ